MGPQPVDGHPAGPVQGFEDSELAAPAELEERPSHISAAASRHSLPMDPERSRSMAASDAEQAETALAVASAASHSSESSRSGAVAFEKQCRRLFVPPRAISAWAHGAARPWTFMLFTWAILILDPAVPAVTYFYGARRMPIRKKWAVRIVAAVVVAVKVCGAPLVWHAGPDLLRVHPGACAFMLLAFAPSQLFLDLSSALAPLDRVPFQSRIAFLLSAGAAHWMLTAMSAACTHPQMAYKRSAGLWPVMWSATITSLRAADSLSDLMYVRLLWDKVCALPPLPCVSSPASERGADDALAFVAEAVSFALLQRVPRGAAELPVKRK